MKGFFEQIASRNSTRCLMAAWVLPETPQRISGDAADRADENPTRAAGKNAAGRALFEKDETGWALVCHEGDFPCQCIHAIEAQKNLQPGIAVWEGVHIFLEQISGRRKLVICGAGHVSMPIIRIGALLDFEITVIEDREEHAKRAEAAGANHVICQPFEEALDEIEGDPDTAFVVVTRAHSHDLDCLRRILQKSYAYAGMMGSRSRTQQIREQLIRDGFEADKVNGLHMPIGLPIGSRTPEEIAVSIAAEIVKEMNENDPGECFPEGMPEEICRLRGETEATAESAKTQMEEAPRPTQKQLPAAVLAMIVDKNGEAPRRPGTKMLVRGDGSFMGTVGGGFAEAQILQTARRMLKQRETGSRLVQIDMRKGIMLCGGSISVLLMPV